MLVVGSWSPTANTCFVLDEYYSGSWCPCIPALSPVSFGFSEHLALDPPRYKHCTPIDAFHYFSFFFNYDGPRFLLQVLPSPFSKHLYRELPESALTARLCVSVLCTAWVVCVGYAGTLPTFNFCVAHLRWFNFEWSLSLYNQACKRTRSIKNIFFSYNNYCIRCIFYIAEHSSILYYHFLLTIKIKNCLTKP